VARWALLGAALVALTLAAPARAAAPNYILVSGPGLTRPVVLDDWDENLVLMSALAEAPKAGRAVVRRLARRPRFLLAEFWGWGGMPRPTSAAQANQRGWFYPARGRQPAVFRVMVDGTMAPRIAPARALAILAGHGIPTRRG
jgi:hypothetical protein